jgi:hypothetical protein
MTKFILNMTGKAHLIKKLLCFPNIYHVNWDVPLGYLAAAANFNYQINI